MCYNRILSLAILLFIIVSPGSGQGKVSPLEIAAAMDMKSIEHTFINMDKYFPIKEIRKTKSPHIFPKGASVELPSTFDYEGEEFEVAKFIDSSYTQGLLIIQDDQLVYEDYMRGQTEETRHISWSMAKSYISALFGIAIDEGYIKSIEQTVDEYVPSLKESGYEGVSIKDVLQMSTGVKFDETYSDPNSDINRWFQAFILGQSQDTFAGTLVNEREPGTYNQYVSINTHVLGMILARATGRSVTDYMTEKICEPIGIEHDMFWLIDGEETEMYLGGLNATLRDFAKLGQLFLHKGNWKGKQLVSTSWVEVSTRADGEHVQPHSKNSASPGRGYGYQWWVTDGDEGEFMAIGVFNQYVYVNPTTKTVIAKNSANQNFYDGSNPYASSLVHLEMFRKIAHSIK